MPTEASKPNYLKLLAVAIVEQPRSTLQELAVSTGISKATLHRRYGTRESLEHALFDKAKESFECIIAIAEKEFEDYRKGLNMLIHAHYENKELLRLFSVYQPNAESECWLSYSRSIDAFFLQGQKQGIFRIDLSAQALSEVFTGTICSMIDAERRGRVPTRGVEETIEKFFSQGLLTDLHEDKANSIADR